MTEPEQTWWTAAQLAVAGLPDLPDTKRGVNALARREGWARQPGKARRSKARGGGLEYHWTLLPVRARMSLMRKTEAPAPIRSREDAWADFETLGKKARTEAETRLTAISAVEDLEGAGLTRSAAVADVAKQFGRSQKTLWNWLALVEGIPAADRLAYVAPQKRGAGARTRTPIDPAFLDLVKSDWLRPEGPSLTSCHERAARVARAEGITVAPVHAVRREISRTVSKPTEIYWRKGAEALRRYFPHQTRDKSAMDPLECICGDFHRFDVFVHWPGETGPVRAQMVAFTDIYSGKILSWRLSTTANSHTVQLCLGDLIERYGIPQGALLDNGREFAAKAITGGTETRFRFKVTDEDIPGLLPLLGVKVHWATPYSGQSKPIERAFRDLCDRVAKHPAFSGAYTGNKPDAKPENYGDRAVPLEEFQAVLAEEIDAHNARPGRRSEVAFGRSFNEVFNERYKTAPIRRATDEQRRLWLLRAEGINAARGNGEIKLHGSRYWAEWMYRVAGQKIAARFDPDNLHAGIEVYDLDGAWLGHAACLDKGNFISVEDARSHARKRAQFLRASKDAARAEREFGANEIAARLRAAGRDATPDDLPEADVVRLPTPHAKAPRKIVRQPSPEEREAEARLAAEVARLEDHRPLPADEDPETRFQRAHELLALRGEGQPLTDAQSAWLQEYRQSSEYRGFARMYGASGVEQ